MLIRLRKPSREAILDIVDQSSSLDFTYPDVGATRRGDHPNGYRLDRYRVRLGEGQETFTAAKDALCQWRHFQLGWVELYRHPILPAAGQEVGVLARAAGMWTINLCRVVYVIEEPQPVHRFAFAYGTLPQHAESGEERFQVEWHPEDDSVWYDILAFSKPNAWLAKALKRYARGKQKQFANDSLNAMKDATLAAKMNSRSRRDTLALNELAINKVAVDEATLDGATAASTISTPQENGDRDR